MKIKPEHQQHIKQHIEQVLVKYPNIASEYEQGRFAKSEQVKDLQKRFCFDLLFGAGLKTWICENIYAYADDSHIYSFLKSICPKVERKYV